MNKFDRVFAILILLQTKNITKAKTISDRFGVSLRTIYRDIKTLKTAGVPIIGDAGIGYSIMSGYQIPPVMFNEGETAALLTAEKFIGTLTDQNSQAYYSSAMLKIKSILKSSQKQSLDILDKSIAISISSNKEGGNYLSEIFQAIASKKIVFIKYQKANGSESERSLEPLGCYQQGRNWYLFAYCQLKEDYRTFKTDRIEYLNVTTKKYLTEHITLQDYINKKDEAWRAAQNFQTIEVSFKNSVLNYAESRKTYFGFIKELKIDDEVQMTFLNSSIDIFARWLLQFGNQATVVSPVSLKNQLKSLAEEIYNHY